MGLLNVMAQDNYIMYNINLARNIGIDEAILIGELARKYNYWDMNNKLTDDGFFFITRDDIEKDTSLSDHRQREAFRKLQELGIVIVNNNKGSVRVNYYKVDENELVKYMTPQTVESLVSKNLTLQTAETEGSKLQNLQTTNTINTNTTTNTTTKETDYEKKKRITETQKTILDYFNKICGTEYNVKSDGYQLEALLKLDSYSIDEIKQVIDYKFKEWGEIPYRFSDGTWSTKNLTPKTIFKKSNFTKYWGELNKKDQTNMKVSSKSESSPILEKSEFTF